MNKHCSLLFTIAIFCCSTVFAQTDINTTDIVFTTAQKLRFIDSVKNANLQPMADTIAYRADSIFRYRKNMDHTFSAADLKALRAAFSAPTTYSTVYIDTALAIRIFKGFNPATDTLHLNETHDAVSLDLIPLGRNRLAFDEYAICIGDRSASAWENDVYFFRKNHLISVHHIYHHYGIEMNHFKDSKGRTVIYYKENFVSGSGIWHFNYYFYIYNAGRLEPALNVLQNGNYTWDGPRNFWLETKIVSKVPLRLKFEYHFSFGFYGRANMLKTYDMVTYRQDRSGKYTGDFFHAKLNRQKMLTYYVDSDELLFIQSYYKEIKQWLNGGGTRRKYALAYINTVMNHVYTARK